MAKRAALANAPIEPETMREKQLQFIMRMRLRGFTNYRIIAECKAPPDGIAPISRDLVAKLMAEGLEMLRKDTEVDKTFSKSEQIARLRNYLAQLTQLRPKLRKGKPVYDAEGNRVYLPLPTKSILSLEKLLAQIEGNFEPFKQTIDVRVSGALAHVVSQINPDKYQELLQRGLERRRLALAAGERETSR